MDGHRNGMKVGVRSTGDFTVDMSEHPSASTQEVTAASSLGRGRSREVAPGGPPPSPAAPGGPPLLTTPPHRGGGGDVGGAGGGAAGGGTRPPPAEWVKTGGAFVYALGALVATCVTIAIVHEKVPDMAVSPPLPDVFFERASRVEWAFSVCEINGVLLVTMWFAQWACLTHRSIIGRRYFFIIGTLYMYRCVTMYVTTLPVPGKHFHCSPKVLGDVELQMRRVVKLIAGGGLTMTGAHTLCGDYLYSGHTVVLTLTCLFAHQYSPRRWLWYRVLCLLLAGTGVAAILFAHDHYSIDVLAAYYVTTRLHYTYHAMATTPDLKLRGSSNWFGRLWWFRVFLILEENVPCSVPLRFSLPLLGGRDRHRGYARIDI